MYQSSIKVSEVKGEAVQPSTTKNDYPSADDRTVDYRTTIPISLVIPCRCILFRSLLKVLIFLSTKKSLGIGGPLGLSSSHIQPPPISERTPKMPKSVERFQAEHNPSDLKNKALWIDYARDDEMKRQMNVIEKKKGVNAILLGIFEEVGAWTSFPTMGVDYLALLLSTHLKRDARFRLTRFLLHNGCNLIRIALWYKM